MEVVSPKQLDQKIRRLAVEIWEHHYNSQSVILAGINNNGYAFAEMLSKELKKVSLLDISLCRLQLNPAAPLSAPVHIDIDNKELTNNNIIIVDDVANTGRTLFYSFKAILDVLPSKVEIAVLIDRKHKSYPVKVDYVGLSLATTLKNDIQVDLKAKQVLLN